MPGEAATRGGLPVPLGALAFLQVIAILELLGLGVVEQLNDELTDGKPRSVSAQLLALGLRPQLALILPTPLERCLAGWEGLLDLGVWLHPNVCGVIPAAVLSAAALHTDCHCLHVRRA
jgi:hypothetical protein